MLLLVYLTMLVMMVLTEKMVHPVNPVYKAKRVSPVYRENKAILVNGEM